MSHPSRVVASALGKSLVATRHLPAGVVVEVFDGPVVSWANVPEDEVRHVLWIDRDEWLVPTTSARYANHSCMPSCEVDDLRVITRRPVSEGEELTIDYVRVSELDPNDPDSFWDPRWTFDCQCGTARCRGRVDGYIVEPA
jgi:hypothetical protein